MLFRNWLFRNLLNVIFHAAKYRIGIQVDVNFYDKFAETQCKIIKIE